MSSDNNEEKFTRTVAFMKQRQAEKEKDGRWTGKVSFVIGAVGAAAIVLGTWAEIRLTKHSDTATLY